MSISIHNFSCGLINDFVEHIAAANSNFLELPLLVGTTIPVEKVDISMGVRVQHSIVRSMDYLVIPIPKGSHNGSESGDGHE